MKQKQFQSKFLNVRKVMCGLVWFRLICLFVCFVVWMDVLIGSGELCCALGGGLMCCSMVDGRLSQNIR